MAEFNKDFEDKIDRIRDWVNCIESESDMYYFGHDDVKSAIHKHFDTAIEALDKIYDEIKGSYEY